VIELEDLTVSFGAVRPLDRLNLGIQAPTHGIIGPNGAGKTTLLNAFSGFAGSVTGTIVAFGNDLTAMSPRHRARWGLRRTFQTVQLAEDLSARDNILVSVDHCPHGFGHKRHAASAVCELVGLDDPTRLASQLTTYERRLTEIARALAGKPRLVLMDEPAAGISGAERALLTQLLLRLHNEVGTWLILIDHDVDLISSVCETTTALDFGAHVTSGRTVDVLADPLVAEAYLGTSRTGTT
jgi:branched-chain amino acid transport system ATP-binding protein